MTLKADKLFQEVHKFQRKHPLNSMTLQMRRQTALGPAGAAGRPALRGEKPGGEPAITPPQMVEEQPAWAPRLRPCAVRGTNLLLLSVETINSPTSGYCLAVCGIYVYVCGFFSPYLNCLLNRHKRPSSRPSISNGRKQKPADQTLMNQPLVIFLIKV